MATSAIIWIQQGKVKRSSVKSSGVCPQTQLSQHMLRSHRAGEKRADALAWGTSTFEEFSLKSTGVNQGQKMMCFVTNIHIFTVNVCDSHPNDNGCQEPAVFGAGKETRRQLGRLLCSQLSSEGTNSFLLTEMVFQCYEAFLDNNWFMRGVFVCLFVNFFLFLLVLGGGCSYLFCTLGSKSS